MEGVRGDLILEPYQAGWRGRPMLLAYLFEDGGAGAELLPRLEGARVARVREVLKIVGMEAVSRGRKSHSLLLVNASDVVLGVWARIH